jgi:uncharacterized UBP type Zn finger protein
MNITDCLHAPKTLSKPRTDKCEGGDIEMHEFGLRVCLTCGYVGCCEDDPGQHALKHSKESGHQVIASYPADDTSFIWCYADNDYLKK